MSKEQPNEETYRITLGDGSSIEVHCPICGGKHFSSAKPPQIPEGKGFQHVIIGREVERIEEEQRGSPGRTMALPIKFKFCVNCGFVLKFILEQSEKDRGEDQA
jgi:hypothetical protein